MYLGMQSNTYITGNNLIPISVPLCGCKLKVASFPDSTSRMFGRWSLGTRLVNRKDGVIMMSLGLYSSVWMRLIIIGIQVVKGLT